MTSHVVERALELISDHLRKKRAEGGDVSALRIARQVKEQQPASMQAPAAAPPAPLSGAQYMAEKVPTEGSVFARSPVAESPLMGTFQQENVPGVIVSPRPGMKATRYSERGDPSIKTDDDLKKWSPSTPDIIGAPIPPPAQAPIFKEPRNQALERSTRGIFNNKNFHQLVEEVAGVPGHELRVTPIRGMWEGKEEPSFVLQHPQLTPEGSKKLANLLGMGFLQDAAIHIEHNPNVEQGTPTILVGGQKKLSPAQVDAAMEVAKAEGLDPSTTVDGKALKFFHFGGEEEMPAFMDKVKRVAEKAGLPEQTLVHSKTELHEHENYQSNLFGESRPEDGDFGSATRSPDLFRRLVDHVLAPYSKAIAGEGYRVSPERLAEKYGLNPELTDYVRQAMAPTGKKSEDRSSVPLMTGEEQLDLRKEGKPSVNDVMFGLQNRAARMGQIEPGDYSDASKRQIAKMIADEVKYHVDNSEKPAIGWYDDALKRANGHYIADDIFPEINSDPDKRLLFHSILGITSQGNDVYANSIYAARVYDLVRDGKMTIPQAVQKLKGTFGAQTRAIEMNLMKLDHLLNTNGYDAMRDAMNKTMTVSEWNRELKNNKDLYGPEGKPLSVDGAKDQKVTGWMVFGPKIGSFINNLRGDYSTLTADLWWSRSWNRMLGYNFIHTPLAEAKQYRDFRDALKAEYNHHNGTPGEQMPFTEDGKINPNRQWLHGKDVADMSREEFEQTLNDPEAMQELASRLYTDYKEGGFKEKSDLRRRAKNWLENRNLPVAAPRGDKEREFQQNTAEEAQKILKKKYGMDISIADIQAALWFHEKELFGQMGATTDRSAPADYADAAKRTVDAMRRGDLYKPQTKMKKGKPPATEEEPMARGGRTEKRHPLHGIPGIHIVGHDPVFTGER